jgi:hypothetical protein
MIKCDRCGETVLNIYCRCACQREPQTQSERIAELEQQLSQEMLKSAKLREALEFYADPNSYFAILMWPDRPCGEFMDDISDADSWSDFPFNREMHGKRARAALEASDEQI